MIYYFKILPNPEDLTGVQIILNINYRTIYRFTSKGGVVFQAEGLTGEYIHNLIFEI